MLGLVTQISEFFKRFAVMKRKRTEPVPSAEDGVLVDDMALLGALHAIGAPKRLAPMRNRLVFWFRNEDVQAARTLLFLTKDEDYQPNGLS